MATECSEKCRPKPPNRTKPRRFDANSAARAYCAARKNGMSHVQFQQALQERCFVPEECDCERLRALLRVSASAMAVAAAALGVLTFVTARNPLLNLFLRLFGRQALEDLNKSRLELEHLSEMIETELVDGVYEPVVISPP